LPEDDTGAQAQAISPAIVPGQRFPNVAPSVRVASVPVTSPLDIVLASLINAASRPGGSDAGKNHDGATDSSLEDMLALMRATAPKS
jgi:hypothetical protein